MHAAHADPARDARVAVGHADRPALVAGLVKSRAAADERVGDDQVAGAEHPERVLDALGGDRRADDVGYGGGLRRCQMRPLLTAPMLIVSRGSGPVSLVV